MAPEIQATLFSNKPPERLDLRDGVERDRFFAMFI